MCGESVSGLPGCDFSLGSPPHVWGKPNVDEPTKFDARITPTCVGKAHIVCFGNIGNRDHPHMCGESCHSQFELTACQGSPPHVWGKRKPFGFASGILRITPTCVGKAAGGDWLEQELKDHPHMCGESLYALPIILYRVGSPPHVWGKRDEDSAVPELPGITPTCVGKAFLAGLCTPSIQDHPHMCGESRHIQA